MIFINIKTNLTDLVLSSGLGELGGVTEDQVHEWIESTEGSLNLER